MGREGAEHSLCPHQAASGTQMEGIPFPTSSAPAPKQREEEQTLEATSRSDCLEWRLDPQRANVESGLHHVWSQSWHCSPKWWHQTPTPTLSLAPCFSPSGRDPSQTLRSRLSFLKAKSRWSPSLGHSPNQPTWWGHGQLPLDPEHRGAAGRKWQGPGSCQPGAELICTHLRLGKGLAWGQRNRYLICSPPSGSDGYWNMVMGVV